MQCNNCNFENNLLKSNTNISNLNNLISSLDSFCPKDQIDELKELLAKQELSDDALDGIMLFLKDHHFDIPALVTFLEKEHMPMLSIHKRKTQKINYLYAAAIILAIAMFGFYFIRDQNYHNKIKGYTLTDNSLPVFASSEQSNTESYKLINAYKTGDTKLGIQQFEQIQKVNQPINDTTLYIAALLYLKNEDFENSISLFEKIDDEFLTEKVTYFKSIGLLHLRKQQEAKLHLQKITNTKDDYLNKQVKTLLNSELFTK